nr:MAG TPA: hypothetical protein [Caudoviricetes sp.]
MLIWYWKKYKLQELNRARTYNVLRAITIFH